LDVGRGWPGLAKLENDVTKMNQFFYSTQTPKNVNLTSKMLNKKKQIELNYTTNPSKYTNTFTPHPNSSP
jgi:hypothetical protein